MPESLTYDALSTTKYRTVKSVFYGTLGVVELAADSTTGVVVAIKLLERGERVTKSIQREILTHRSLVHPQIVQLIEVFVTPQHLGIVMEHDPGIVLSEYICRRGCLQENLARWIFQQLIIGLEYLHRQGVTARGLRLESIIVVDEGELPLVLLRDFRYSAADYLPQRLSLPVTVAPEVILSSRGQAIDEEAGDIWSCGLALYQMLFRSNPFTRQEDRHDPKRLLKTMQRILRVEYELPQRSLVSEQCRDLLSKMLQLQHKRISLAEIKQHPWFLQDLPPAAGLMNDIMPVFEPKAQSVEETARIIEEAQKSSTFEPWEEDNDSNAEDTFNCSSFDEWGMNDWLSTGSQALRPAGELKAFTTL